MSVIPDPDFVLSEAGGKDDVTATVVQPDTEYFFTDLEGDGTEYDGVVQAELSAGEWSGKFYFNIEFYDTIIILPEPGKTLDDYTWAEISIISKAGKASEYFNVGDTKKMTLSNKEVHYAQIIGFNHDDLINEEGDLTEKKAGITFQFKNVMDTKVEMNSTNTNVGGWEYSKMRTYVNNDVFALLPTELQAEIKTVDKVSDAGNKDKTTLIHTSDKLFLLSAAELGFGTEWTVPGQAGQSGPYKYYIDTDDNLKRGTNNTISSWWLRSACTTYNTDFIYITDKYNGTMTYDGAYYKKGVAPAFCI